MKGDVASDIRGVRTTMKPDIIGIAVVVPKIDIVRRGVVVGMLKTIGENLRESTYAIGLNTPRSSHLVAKVLNDFRDMALRGMKFLRTATRCRSSPT